MPSKTPDLGSVSASASEQVQFESIPWCKTILDDPEFLVEPCPSRVYKPGGTEDALLSRTLKNSDTIEGWVSMYRRRPSTDTDTDTTTTINTNLNRRWKDEGRTLLSLRPGLDGYPGICHGGIVATLLDEIMSLLVSECRRSQGLSVVADNVTADLHLTYIKPVPTPAVVLCRAKVRDIQGRKYFVDADLVDEKGVVLAKADGLFISLQKEKL